MYVYIYIYLFIGIRDMIIWCDVIWLPASYITWHSMVENNRKYSISQTGIARAASYPDLSGRASKTLCIQGRMETMVSILSRNMTHTHTEPKIQTSGFSVFFPPVVGWHHVVSPLLGKGLDQFGVACAPGCHGWCLQGLSWSSAWVRLSVDCLES